VPQQLDGIGIGTRFRHDVRDDGLAGARVRLAHHRDVGDVGVLREHLLDLTRIDVEARHDHDVFGALHEREPAVVVGDAHVAGVQPPAGEHALGRVRIAPVAGEDVGAAHEDLAGVAREDVLAVGVDQPHLDAGQRGSDRADARACGHRAGRHDR